MEAEFIDFPSLKGFPANYTAKVLRYKCIKRKIFFSNCFEITPSFSFK